MAGGSVTPGGSRSVRWAALLGTPSTRVALLTVALALTCAFAVPLPAAHVPAGMVRPPWWAVALIFAATELWVFRIRVHREEQSVSISELPLVVGLFSLAPGWLLLARLLGSGAVFVLHRRTTPLKTFFNLALVGAGTTVAVLVFRLVGQGADALTVRGWVAAVLATAASGLVDGLLLTLVIAWYDGRPGLRTVVTQVAGALALPAGVSVAGVLAAFALSLGGGAVLPLVLTCVVVLVGYRAYAVLADRHAALERLFSLGRDLHDARELDAAAHATVSHCVALMRAERAELYVGLPGQGSMSRWTATPGDPVVEDVVPVSQVPAEVTRRGHGIVQRLHVHDGGATGDEGVDMVLTVGQRSGEVRGYSAAEIKLLANITQQCTLALRHAHVVRRLRHDALHDHLTGLPNRSVFRSMAEKAVAVSVRGGPASAVGILDLDGFKSVNDSLGHLAGDQVIAEIGRRMDALAGDGLHVSRLGGDEFGVLIAPAQDPGEVLAVARRLLAVLNEPVVIAGEHIRLAGSLGLAMAPRDGRDADAVLRNADVAMYAAKQDSGGIRLYASELAAAVEAPLSLAADLRLGLARGEVGIAVQPLVDLETGAMHSVEALARWRHPALGWVDPESFVVAAERGGLVGELTAVVLDQALAACTRWRAAGLDVRVAVNLAARTLADPDLPDVVEAALAAHDLTGDMLTLELTEGGVIASRDRVLTVIAGLRELGVGLAVDDFGTGYSSLTYLSWLSPDQLKIDKSFVQRLRGDARNEAIVRSIIGLAGTLGLQVVAEGVGDPATAEALVRLGCRLGQGYLFAEPMPPDQLVGWAAQRDADAIAVADAVADRDEVAAVTVRDVTIDLREDRTIDLRDGDAVEEAAQPGAVERPSAVERRDDSGDGDGEGRLRIVR